MPLVIANPAEGGSAERPVDEFVPQAVPDHVCHPEADGLRHVAAARPPLCHHACLLQPACHGFAVTQAFGLQM